MKHNTEGVVAPISPLLLDEATAAAALNESPQTRRVRRYEDEKRLASGKPIQGPRWIRDGKRVKYRWFDLQSYAAALSTQGEQ